MESRDPLTIPEEHVPSAPFDELRDRERAVVAELERAQGGRIAFQALRRRLDLHPQALTRTLRNLESAGWVRHDDLGYSLSASSNAPPSDLPATVERVPVFAALMPPHLEPQRVVEQLQQRWFNGLRWFGVAQNGSETVLTWSTESQGRPVRLRVTSTMVGVELEGNEAARDLATVAPLMQALAVLYGRAAPNAPNLTGQAQ